MGWECVAHSKIWQLGGCALAVDGIPVEAARRAGI